MVFNAVINVISVILWWPVLLSMLSGILLTHSHSMTPFDAPGKQAFWKHCGKRRNCSLRAISPFPTVFSTSLNNSLPFSSNLKLSFAKSFDLEQCKICRLVMGQPVLCTIFLSHTIIIETINSSERRMNPVTMTIINPLKEYWPSWRFETATACSQVLYATNWATGAGQDQLEVLWPNKRQNYEPLKSRNNFYAPTSIRSGLIVFAICLSVCLSITPSVCGKNSNMAIDF